MGPLWLHAIAIAICFGSASGALAFEEVELTELGLTLDLPDDIENLTDRGGQSTQLAHSWTGELEDAQVSIQLWLLPIAQFRFQEPADVNALIADNYRRDRDRVGGGAGFAWSDQRMVKGKFGVAPYGCLTRADLRAKGRTDLAGTLHMVSGLLPESGYALQVVCQPAANEDQVA